jgi:hypothetical protein
MEVDAKSNVCPICAYEFTDRNNSYLKWIALMLAILFFLYLIL